MKAFGTCARPPVVENVLIGDAQTDGIPARTHAIYNLTISPTSTEMYCPCHCDEPASRVGGWRAKGTDWSGQSQDAIGHAMHAKSL
eukprot:5705560-Amphidinium_carterae.2